MYELLCMEPPVDDQKKDQAWLLSNSLYMILYSHYVLFLEEGPDFIGVSPHPKSWLAPGEEGDESMEVLPWYLSISPELKELYE